LIFLTFEDLEIRLVIICLATLVIAQLAFIMSRIKPRQKLQASKPRAPAKKPIRKKKATPKPKLESGLDPNVFTKFQQNLNQSEKAVNITDKKTAPSETADVVVSISSKGKQSTPQKKKTAKKDISQKQPLIKKDIPQKKPESLKDTKPETDTTYNPGLPDSIPVEPIGSLFDDAQEPLGTLTGNVTKSRKSETSENQPDLESSTEKGYQELAKTPIKDAPLVSQEILTPDDLQENEQETKEEAALFLSLAQKKFEKGQFEDTLTSIRQFLTDRLKTVSDPEIINKALQLKGECEFALNQYEKSSKTWQEIFQKYVPRDHTEFLPLLEKLIGKYIEIDQQQYAVHFLFTALNEYRQAHEFSKMDELYSEIENAYQQQNDSPRLIQTYQNHLAIKKSLHDYGGQLDLLDHLGKLLYDQGDAEGSKKCYEERLTIENKMSQ